MMMWRALILTCVVAALAGTTRSVAAQQVAARDDGAQVLLTQAQALREVFPDATGFRFHEFAPTAAQRATLEDALGRRLFEPTYRFLLVYDRAGHLQGYALVTDERGKYRPITFMVGVTPDFRVADAAVMVYRESRGGEVQRARFLSQYRGRTMRDPIQINRDIVNISGATISVRSMNAGVRKALAVAHAAFAAGVPALSGAPSPLSALR